MNQLKNLKIPKHIGIIMDGNGRWAKARGMNVIRGHQEGARRVKEITRYCGEIGVKYLSLYAFSTENWSRPKKEIDALMDLLVNFLETEMEELIKNNIKLVTAGRRENFTKKVNSSLDSTIKKTGKNNGLTLVLCLDYGGKQEIVDAANKIKKKHKEIDIKSFRDNLYVPWVPDIDLLIRTSGEKRISNFMLWRISYSELYFSTELWPDFTEDELDKAIKSYNSRQRRFGMRT
ncbi:MAG: isoprenyl transferase [Elusimicrobiota bacterium]